MYSGTEKTWPMIQMIDLGQTAKEWQKNVTKYDKKWHNKIERNESLSWDPIAPQENINFPRCETVYFWNPGKNVSESSKTQLFY